MPLHRKKVELLQSLARIESGRGTRDPAQALAQGGMKHSSLKTALLPIKEQRLVPIGRIRVKITSFKITRLFDIFNHYFELNSAENITILYAPNGYGKTAILRLIDAVTSARLHAIRSIPFESMALGFDDDTQLAIIKDPAEPPAKRRKCTFTLSRKGSPVDIKEWALGEQDDLDAAVYARAPFLRKIGEELWEDQNDGEIITSPEIQRRLGIDLRDEGSIEASKWLKQQMASVSVRFIETQRLMRHSPRPQRSRTPRPPQSSDFSSVSDYARQLASSIQGVLASYAEKSQRLDQTFPSRLLARFQSEAQPGISADELGRQLLALDKKRLRLREAGLLEKEEEIVELPKEVEGEVRRLLGLYLTDVSEKLETFDSILNRIEILREIVDGHFRFKRMKISREQGFRFQTDTGINLAASSLSSGEQHLLILIYELLFVEREESLFLIDEPEISLHIGWQLSFLADLQRIAGINNSNILIATHSPQIIGDRDDLAVALQEPEVQRAGSEK